MKTFRHWLFLPTLLASTAFYAPASHAAAELLAVGTLTNPFDLSTATSGALENGVAGNTLGGLGSGLGRWFDLPGTAGSWPERQFLQRAG